MPSIPLFSTSDESRLDLPQVITQNKEIEADILESPNKIVILIFDFCYTRSEPLKVIKRYLYW